MRYMRSTHTVDIPENVKAEVKSRKVRITGPRGTSVRSFQHINADLQLVNKGRQLKIEIWFGLRKELACLRTVASHVENMIKGVTIGYKFKMRFAYAHFPVNVTTTPNGKTVEIRNFLGEKRARFISLPGDMKSYRSADVKDELVIEGNDLNQVSQSAAQIQQSCRVKNKDIRKFLDGIYVSEKLNVIEQ